ncbi:hypothetical protein [Xenorhabdus bovienii]|uniref:Uncharacterized protein n=1 Tax=Xenorhabdus bovienii str. kraussei Becker Underwood TaxID=1398204 RepID=A0A077PTH7_XENBV|nr:hypothetical protein [Xenorhabdus bovienii]CDH24091.1 hypothetical protein XBKB1_2380007 [Xenorhabdus bovienii str. kraussei Becker Underwood]
MFSKNKVIEVNVDGVNYRYSHAEGTVHKEEEGRWMMFCKLSVADVPSKEYLANDIRFRNMYSE